MAEGKYYILLDEIDNSIIPVYKPIPVCYDTHNGFTFSKTENTISKYQLLGGCKSIYLFNEYQEFVLKLKEIIKNKYNNKLYTYQGKIPIKLEVKYSKDWHDPLDKMEIALFNTGAYRPSHGTFGNMRKEGSQIHIGLDLFALDGTPVYACMDGVIHYNYTDIRKNYGFGYRIFLEINTEKGLEIYRNRIKETNYQLLYPNLKEILMGDGYKEDSNVYTFAYCHLKEFDHKLIGTTKEVKAGDLIGYTGSTGNAGGSDSPHLHIEIRSIGAVGLAGLGKKINPSCIFDFKYPSNEIAKCNKWSDHKSINDFFSDKNPYKEYIKTNFTEQYNYVAAKYNKK